MLNRRGIETGTPSLLFFNFGDLPCRALNVGHQDRVRGGVLDCGRSLLGRIPSGYR